MTALKAQGIEEITLQNILLANVLDGLEDEESVHLVVIASGSYQSADVPDRHRDKRLRLLSTDSRVG